jgi:hypothetical protein
VGTPSAKPAHPDCVALDQHLRVHLAPFRVVAPVAPAHSGQAAIRKCSLNVVIKAIDRSIV